MRTWEELDRPCSRRAVDDAVACAERRHGPRPTSERCWCTGTWATSGTPWRPATGFKLVDPDGLLAEPEYDLGIIIREDPEELLVGDPRRARWLARRSRLDEQAIWEWGVVERVSTGLLGLQAGYGPPARGCSTWPSGSPTVTARDRARNPDDAVEPLPAPRRRPAGFPTVTVKVSCGAETTPEALVTCRHPAQTGPTTGRHGEVGEVQR